MWRAGAKLAALTLLGGAGAAAIATSDDPSSNFKIGTIVSLRLFRDSITAATMAFDYQYSLWGLKEGSNEWLRAKHEVHNRFAYRLQELCFHNGGIYIKLGQHNWSIGICSSSRICTNNEGLNAEEMSSFLL
ncbi:putative ABC1 protein At2g40090 [Phoenix dactylifera]|uniref:ABC1 protein At2g40090 n=1 Tax=Phoenix dactylifera TaxID=42345 RepID=A0A8B7BWK9_PHODC|nr:putative ABC1 protein At2g40090 [Phoenix dactylifera]XP_038986460.1 putative ABC1 protein At2g40090 [Phoenix dactylifera]